VTDPSGTTGDGGAESTPPRCLTSTGPGALLRWIIRKGPRSGVASGRGVPAVSTVTTSPLAACCATNVPRDVRPAGASTSPAAPPRREITVRSISSAVCRARSSISRVEGPPEVVVLDSGVCQVCSVGVDSYDQFMGPVRLQSR